MRLRSITLANFKSFADEVEIPLGRITCLIGRNGAGKSNALYGLEKLAAVLSGGNYQPKKADYFNDSDDAEMRLGVTLELSGVEQQALLDRPRTKSAAYSHGDLVGRPLFRMIKYVVSFRNDPKQSQEEVWLSDALGKLRLFVRASRRDNKCDIEHRNIEAINLKGPIFPDSELYTQNKPLGTAALFGMMDNTLFPAVQRMFAGMKIIPADRTIPSKVPAIQTNGLSPDGQNLPSALNDLRRVEQIEFDKCMASVTHGDPLSVEPRTVGSDLMLEAREGGISRDTPHTDLGTGQIQTLILGLQVFSGTGTVFVVKEPELHLHAERQKQILRLIRDKSLKGDAQFVIETHSPAFLGTSPGEQVILVTKDEGRSSITEIGPDNVGLICRELGITHADALSPANILFVEGPSDIAAFEPFLSAVAPERALSTMIYSLDGAYNTRNLKMLIKYLRTEGRRMFVILDGDDEARRQVEELRGAGLLAGNYHFLEKNMEDEFDDDLVVRAARKVAAEAGGGLALTAAELRASRNKGEAVAATLQKHWDAEQCGNFSKIKLAERIVGLAGGRAPPGIEAALRAAAAYFEGSNNGGAKTANRDGGAGQGGVNKP